MFAMNGSIGVSLGNGDGTFGAMTLLPSGSFPGVYLGLVVADFNGDGILRLPISVLHLEDLEPSHSMPATVSTFAAPTAVTLVIRMAWTSGNRTRSFSGTRKR